MFILYGTRCLQYCFSVVVFCCVFIVRYKRQSFGTRVLVAGVFSFLTVLALYLVGRCCIACCSRKTSRAVYLGNVKMHYEVMFLTSLFANHIEMLFMNFMFFFLSYH